ncbi:relaxase/mobilization nuclease domain-containing protein (plasmid) [Moraxella sp. DOX410]|nr:relaxase/mobilization nuclease domain-containing protein [Moraxella sp. DOX410]WNP28681.1 relaxase/mobilization nuclease domain-containing protein [Moraxella sp. DOX410]
MLVRFFEHGKVKKGELTRTGGGGAVRNYLLFDKDNRSKPRDGARLIYGNDSDTTEVINGIKNSKIYTSGVLSFAPEESITDAQKIEIIESFEQNLFPGLMKGEYSGYWVEHQDKDRQELHFVFADIHLPSGKALPVYYIGKDFDLVDSWKDLINIDYGLEDPNDPKRKRAYRLKGYEYAQKKQQEKDKLAGKAIKDEKVFDEEKIGEWLIEEIADDESIQTQADVIRVIAEAFEITRVAKDGKSISIKNPVGGRNIKLKGMMYEREFTRQRFESLGKTQTRERKNRSELQASNQRERDKRQLRLEQRFAKRRGSDRQLDKRLRSELTEFKQRTDQTSPEPDQLIDSALEPAESKRSAAIASDIKSDREHQNDSDQRSASTWSNGEPRERQRDQSEQNRYANHSRADEDTQSADNHGYKTSNKRTSISTQTNPTNGAHSCNVYSNSDFIRYRFIRLQLLPGIASIYRPTTLRYTAAVYQSNTDTKPSAVDDRYLSERRQRRGNTDYPEESADSILGKESEQRENFARDVATNKPAINNPTQQKVEQHDTAYPYRTHHQAFNDIVERFASENRQQTGANQGRASTTQRYHDNQENDETIGAAIDQAIGAHRPADRAKDPAVQSANHRLLGRIRQASEVRSGNTEKRTRRISKLARQDPINLDPLGCYTTRRRKQVRKFTDRFKEFDSDVKDQYFREQQRTAKLRKLNQRAREVKDGYDENAREFKTAAASFGRLVVAVSAVVKAVVDLFRKLFNAIKQQAYGYASEGVLYHQNPDGSKGKQATTQETRDYIDAHPYDLSGYAKLKLTINTWDKQKKEKTNQPKFRGFGR